MFLGGLHRRKSSSHQNSIAGPIMIIVEVYWWSEFGLLLSDENCVKHLGGKKIPASLVCRYGHMFRQFTHAFFPEICLCQ